MAITGAWDFFKTKVFTFNNLGINLLIGLTVALVLLAFSGNRWLMEMEDASMDWYMQLNKNIILSFKENNIPSVVVLDIDNQTYRNWGEPLFIPRQQLINLIDTAVKAEARLIVVTLDVSQETPVENSQLHPDDKALQIYLANYVVKCKQEKDSSTCPSIILKHNFSTESSHIPLLRTSFLDDIVSQNTPYVQWGAMEFEPASDRIIRRWPLWQSACKNKQPVIIPSVELLAMSALRKGCGTANLQEALQSFRPESCDSNTAQTLPETFNFCGLTVSTTDRWGINQRIMYRVPWLVDDYPPSLPYSVIDESGNRVLRTLSTQFFTESAPQARLKALADNVVVVGASYREGQNIHLTPLDDMSEPLIFVNTLYSLLRYEKIDLHPITNILLIMLFIFVMSTVFKIYPSHKGMIISGVSIVFGLLPLTMMVFHYGMWFYFALPLIVVSVYRLITEYERPNKKAILKDSVCCAASSGH